MKHDLKAFSRDIVALIKTSGDTGGSGDKSKKSLRHNNSFVPTRGSVLSPLSSQWGHERPASGDRNHEQFQPAAGNVPSVPTATTRFEEACDQHEVGRSPDEWHAVLAGLETRCCPDWISIERWQTALSDADDFLTRWGTTADSMGWRPIDLFGVHPSAPAYRFDVMGLLLLIQGGSVVALTAEGATLRRLTGAVLTYRRKDMQDAVMISSVTQ